VENPATWGKAERIIWDILNEPSKNIIGWSIPRRIVFALKEAGLLKDDA
jgi:hypothetical protein